MNDPDPHDRPQGDAVGGWHDDTTEWDQHGFEPFRVFNLDELMNPPERNNDE